MSTVDELPAGDDLNQRIAVLLGFDCLNKRVGRCDGQRKTRCGACGQEGHGNCYGVGRGPMQIPCCTETPDYSGDMAAAWLVMEAVQARGYGVTLRCSAGEPNTWRCLFYKDAGDHKSMARGDGETAPLAICRAALKAVEEQANP